MESILLIWLLFSLCNFLIRGLFQGPSGRGCWFVPCVSLRTSFEALWLPEWPVPNYSIFRGKKPKEPTHATVETSGQACTKWAATSSLWDPSFSSPEGQQYSTFSDFISQIWPANPRLVQSQKFRVIAASSGRRSSVWSVSFGLFLGCPPSLPLPPRGVQLVRSGPEEGEW